MEVLLRERVHTCVGQPKAEEVARLLRQGRARAEGGVEVMFEHRLEEGWSRRVSGARSGAECVERECGKE